MAKPAVDSKLGSTEANGNPIAESVDRLTDEFRSLGTVLESIREDVSWVTRNGLPVQPIEHVHVTRMARDPCADDWNEKLSVERTMIHSPGQLSALGSLDIERIAEELRNAVETLTNGRFEPVLTALDEVRAALLRAIHSPKQDAGGEPLSGDSDEAQDALMLTGECDAAETHTAIPDVPYDATMDVECTAMECGDAYTVEPDALHDGGIIYWPEVMAALEEEL